MHSGFLVIGLSEAKCRRRRDYEVQNPLTSRKTDFRKFRFLPRFAKSK